MKHLLHKLSSMRLLMLLAVLLGIGSGTAWADGTTGSITFGKNDTTIDTAPTTVVNDSQDNTWTISIAGTTSLTTNNAAYQQVGSSKQPASSITFTTTLAEDVNITAFSAGFGGFSGTAGTVTLKVGDTTVGTGSLNATNDVTVSSSTSAVGNTLTITVTDIAKGVKVYNLSYTYEAVAPASPLASIALSGEYPTAFHQDDTFSHEGMTVTATYEDNSTKDVTSKATFTGYDMSTADDQTVTVSYTEGEVTKTATYNITVNALTSISLSGEYQTEFTEGDEFNHDNLVVTANYSDETTVDVTDDAEFSDPDMTQVGPQTITVTYNEVSTTYDITVNAIPTHNVTWSINGATNVASYKEGATISFPTNPENVSGKTFVGWTTAPIEGTASEAPTFVTSATMGATDLIYYAVFAYASGGGSAAVVDELNRAFTGVTSTTYSGWSGKTATSSAVYAGNTAGGNDAIQLRSNNNNSGIVTTTSGGKATKVTVKWNSNTSAGRTLNVYGKNSAYSTASDLYNTNNQGTLLGTIVYDTSTELTIDDDYEYIGIRSASGALYLDKVQITWSTGGGVSYSGYCTTVVEATVAKPVIAVEENPFLFSTTATITCETEGAAIKYSFDGETWNDYTEELTITETTTIYAKAVKNEDVSEVASVTATKNLAEPTLAIDATGITNTNVFDGTEAGSLAAAVTYNDAAVQGAVVTWSGNNDEVATIDDETGAVTLVAAGSVTFTATYAGNSDYSEKTETYELTVTNSDPNVPGSENNPYTVAEAIDAIDNSGNVNGVYVQGVISQIDSYASNYKSITYWISTDGTTTSTQFEVYSGKGLDGADFSSINDLEVGDQVVVTGDIKKYGDIYEFNYNNYIVSLVRKPAAPTFLPAAGAVAAGTSVELSTTTEGATIYYTMDGTDPTTESNEYTSAITITDATTIKAIAVKGTASSDVATAAYTIAVPVATPTFTPGAGTFDSAQEVTISCETEGATIYYSYDNENWTEYTEALNINENKTVYAKAEKEGMAQSEVASVEYTIQIPSIVFDEATPKNLTYEAQTYDFAFVGAYTTGSFAVVVCDYEGKATTYDWFSAELNGNAVRVTLTQNEDSENGREAYFKVTADNAESEIYTVIQGNFVVDYAELPFAFNDGKAAIEETTGLTQDGLGSDYASAPKLKFDTTGDNLVLKINERPGILTFDIKGNGFSGGTFTVQTSEDGTVYSDLETYTGLGDKQEASFDNLGENVRYIKWIYTEKSYGNVALGNIKLAKYVTPTPAIVAPASVELKAEDTAGEIAYTINNPVESTSLTATSDDEWISGITVTEDKVTFTTTVNTGEERTATITLTYGQVVKDVTIKQAEYVEMLSYSLATSITSGKHYIITDGSYQAMGEQASNNRKAVDVTISEGTATFASDAGVYEFVICGPDVDGYYTIYDEVTKGYLYAASGSANQLKTQAQINVNAQWEITIDGESGFASIVAVNSSNRNVMQYNGSSSIFACYSSASQSDVYLFEKDGEAAPTEYITIGTAGYTTYTTQNPVSFPEGVTAYIATEVKPSTIHLEEILDAPARTPIILQAETPNTYTLEKDYAELYVDVVEKTPNILKSSDGTVEGDGSTIYALGVGKVAPYEGEVGFYVVNDGQTVPAGKAYLTIAQASSVKEFLTFDFGELPTGLNDVRSKMEDVSGDIFNLAGQKMNRLQKGINIVNGRKVLVK